MAAIATLTVDGLGVRFRADTEMGAGTLAAPEPERIAASWGDARLGDIMYDQDLSVAGLLDWELASLSSPEADLGWWLFLLRHHTEGIGKPLPTGFPDATTTIARWHVT